MEDQLWNLFRETGEPMGYLLYKAEKKQKETETNQGKQQPPARTPTAEA